MNIEIYFSLCYTLVESLYKYLLLQKGDGVMNKDVLSYFIDLDKEKLARDENNAIIAPSKDVVKLRPDLQASSCRKIVIIKFHQFVFNTFF